MQPNLIHHRFNGLGKEPLERWNFTSILSLGLLRRIHFRFTKYSSLLIQCRITTRLGNRDLIAEIWLKTNSLYIQYIRTVRVNTVARSSAALTDQPIRHALFSFHHSTKHVFRSSPADFGLCGFDSRTIFIFILFLFFGGFFLFFSYRTIKRNLGPTSLSWQQRKRNRSVPLVSLCSTCQREKV